MSTFKKIKKTQNHHTNFVGRLEGCWGSGLPMVTWNLILCKFVQGKKKKTHCIASAQYAWLKNAWLLCGSVFYMILTGMIYVQCIADRSFNKPRSPYLLNKINKVVLTYWRLVQGTTEKKRLATSPQSCNCRSILVSNVVVIWAHGNQHTFRVVAASCSHMIIICNLHSQILTSKANGEAGSRLQVAVMWTPPQNKWPQPELMS